MKARDSKGPSSDGDGDGLPLISVAHALRGEGFDASEDGTGRGTPIVPVAIHSDAIGRDGISKTAGADAAGVVRKRNAGMGIADDGTMYSLTTGQPHAIAIQERAVSENPDAGPDGKGWRDDGAAYTLEEARRSDGSQNSDQEGVLNLRRTSAQQGPLRQALHEGQASWGVRRLTPTEAARLQGFPDDWARIPWRGKAAEDCPDGPQYKAFGNSMAVNVMTFIGERIEAVRDPT